VKAVRIGAMWCPSCLIMRGVYDKLLKDLEIPIEDIDIDLSPIAAQAYQPGTILPVLIILDDGRERLRIVGEKSKKEILKRLEGLHS
jgi:thiol-disulfide isomerase/thioredoxin